VLAAGAFAIVVSPQIDSGLRRTALRDVSLTLRPHWSGLVTRSLTALVL
jgi:hypothetical protein